LSYRSRSSWSGGGFLGFPPAISQLVLINVIVFLLEPLVFKSYAPPGLALVPSDVVTRGMVWELVTYMFLHGGFMHILFNMFFLVMFGADLERWWGSRDFLKYYFITGVGAGLAHMLTSYLFPGSPGLYNGHIVHASGIPTIGASGAVFGVMVAYAMAFPNRQILLWFVIPISARTFVIMSGVIELVIAVQHQPGDSVARFAHVGGMVVGYLYLKHETLWWRAKRWFNRSGGLPRVHLRREENPEDEERVKERIDQILEKISREGMGSLTKEEERLLKKRADRARRRQGGHDA
jgi:membrane associated rhomboid family serine protease